MPHLPSHHLAAATQRYTEARGDLNRAVGTQIRVRLRRPGDVRLTIGGVAFDARQLAANPRFGDGVRRGMAALIAAAEDDLRAEADRQRERVAARLHAVRATADALADNGNGNSNTGGAA